MRIAIVHSFYASDTPSGENSQVEAEVQALAGAGHDVHLVAARTDIEAKRRVYGLRTAIRVATGLGRSPLGELRRIRPDVIHVHNLFPNLGRRWAERSPAPLVATVHNYRFVCAAGTLMRDGNFCDACVAQSSFRGLAYGCYRGSRMATAPVTASLIRGPANDPILRVASKVLCLSERQHALLSRLGLPASRLERSSNFLPATLDPGAGVVDGGRNGWVFVGRLTPEKGVLELVEQWPDDGPNLTVIGEGPLIGAVEAAALGKPVALLGATTRAGVVEALTTAVGLVFPSRWPEVQPLVVIEALASGARVLVTGPSDVGGLTWPGLLEQPIVRGAVKDVVGLQAAPVAARTAFEDRFSEDSFLKQRSLLYRSVMTGQHGTPAAS